LFIGYWSEIFYGFSPEVGNTFRIMIHSRKTVGGGGFLSRSKGRKCTRYEVSLLTPAASSVIVSC